MRWYSGYFASNSLVKRDRLAWARLLQVGARRDAGYFRARRRPCLKIPLRLRRDSRRSAGSSSSRAAGYALLPGLGCIVSLGPVQRRACGTLCLRSRRGRCDDAVFLLDLEIRQAAHRLRHQRRLGCLGEKALVTLDRLFDAAFDLLFLDLDLDVAQLRQGGPLAGRRARGDQDT